MGAVMKLGLASSAHLPPSTWHVLIRSQVYIRHTSEQETVVVLHDIGRAYRAVSIRMAIGYGSIAGQNVTRLCLFAVLPQPGGLWLLIDALYPCIA